MLNIHDIGFQEFLKKVAQVKYLGSFIEHRQRFILGNISVQNIKIGLYHYRISISNIRLLDNFLIIFKTFTGVMSSQGNMSVIIAPSLANVKKLHEKTHSSVTESIKLVTLRHPRTKCSVLYGILTSKSSEVNLTDEEKEVNGKIAQRCDTQFLEVQSINEEFGTWIIGENIVGAPRSLTHMCTPTDPLLVIMPYLIYGSKKGMLVPIDDLLHDGLNEETSEGNEKLSSDSFSIFDEILSSSLVCDRLHKIADCVGSKDLNVWKWNEEKTLNFLTEKVHRLERCLVKNKGLVAEDGSVELGFSSRERADKRNEPGCTDQRYLRLAWEILSEYLLDSISGKIAQKLGINLQESQPLPFQPVIKKPKLEGPTSPVDDYTKGRKTSQQVKKVPTSAKEKAASRACVGTKSISSFFTKK